MNMFKLKKSYLMTLLFGFILFILPNMNVTVLAAADFDLEITRVGIMEEAYKPGDPVHLYAVVKNNGDLAAISTGISIHFFKVNPDNPGKGTPVKWNPDKGEKYKDEIELTSIDETVILEQGKEVACVSSGTYEVPQGEEIFSIKAIAEAVSDAATEVNRSNNVLTAQIEIPTQITITRQSDAIRVQEPVYQLKGEVNRVAEIKINGEAVAQNPDLSFTYTVSLNPGDNPMTVEAVSSSGYAAVPDSFVIEYIPKIPYEYGSALVGEGGWITGIAMHETDDVMYIRTDVGGSYRFDNEKEEWIPLNDDLKNSYETWYQVDGLAVDPNNSRVLYIAVGKASNPSFTYKKGTILKSVDGGENWRKLNIDLYFSGNGDKRWAGERIAVDPANANHIVCGSRKEGIWESVDAGESWSQMAFPGSLKDDYGVLSIVFDPANAGVIYFNAYGDGIYKYTENGNVWEKLPGELNPAGAMRMVLSGQGDLYVTTESNENGLLKYSGGVWTNLTPDSTIIDSKGKPAGYCGISVNPLNTSQIVCAPSEVFPGMLFYSADGGTTWKKIDQGNTVRNKAVSWWPDTFWAAAIASVEFDRHHPNRVWFSDWHGVWKTEDITAENIVWNNIQKGHEELTVMAIKAPPVGTTLAVGGADTGGNILYNYDEYPELRLQGLNYYNVWDYDYCQSNPSEMVVVGSNDKVLASGAVSHDAGKTWTRFQKAPDMGVLSTKVAMSSTNPNVILVTTSDYSVFRTGDAGKTWTELLSLPVCVNGPWTWAQVLEADKVNGSKFYFFDYKTGDIYRSDDAGLNFAKTGSTLPVPSDYRWIYMNTVPGREGEIWVSLYDKGLFRSTDGGSSFERIGGIDRADNIAFGKEAPGSSTPTLYMYGVIGEVEGLFRSLDMGQTWQDIDEGDSGFGNRIQVLEASWSTYGLVFGGTQGRGVRYAKIKDTDILAPKITLAQSNGITNQTNFMISGTLNEIGAVTVNGNPVGTSTGDIFQTEVVLQEGSNTIEICATDAYGNQSFKYIKETLDTVKPVLTINQTSGMVRLAEYTVSGKINETGKVYINGTETAVNSDGTFTAMINLQNGSNTVTVSAIDTAGNEADAATLSLNLVPIAGFDLVVTQIGVESASYVEGEPVYFYAVIKNQGMVKTPLQYVAVHFVVGYDGATEKSGKWYPGNGSQSSTALLAGMFNSQITLEPGQSIVCRSTSPYTVPQSGSQFKLLAIADATCKFTATEADRSNNTLSKLISSTNIKKFQVESQVGETVIDRANKTISFQMNKAAHINNLKPLITLMSGSKMSLAAGSYMDFTKPVVFTVTTSNGVEEKWMALCTLTDDLPDQYFDLVVTEVGIEPLDYQPGDPVKYYAVVKNQGNVATPQQYVHVHFVIGATTAAERSDKRWYPDNGSNSSTAIKAGDTNLNCTIAPGETMRFVTTDAYYLSPRRLSFDLMAIVDATSKFYDSEPVRTNNFSYQRITILPE